MSEGTKKNDRADGKIMMELLPPKPLLAIAEILTMNVEKYGKDNWREGLEWSRYYGALQRHLMAWADCEDLDSETKKSHLAHAACNLIFLMEFEATGNGKDDRYRSDPEFKASGLGHGMTGEPNSLPPITVPLPSIGAPVGAPPTVLTAVDAVQSLADKVTEDIIAEADAEAGKLLTKQGNRMDLGVPHTSREVECGGCGETVVVNILKPDQQKLHGIVAYHGNCDKCNYGNRIEVIKGEACK